MSKVEIKLNLPGINAVMKSKEIQEVLQECGERVAGTASAMDGEAYAARTHLANWIAITNVYPDSAQAARKNFQNNTLLRSLQ